MRNVGTDNVQTAVVVAQVAAVAPTVSGVSTNAPVCSTQEAGERRSSTGEDSASRLFYAESTIASQSEMSLQSFSSTSTDNANIPTQQVNTNTTNAMPASSVNTGQTNKPIYAQQSKIVTALTEKAGGDTPVDMHVLEQELVRMAPTIADLFKKIAKQTSNIPTSEEELRKVKEENERLRKTNKSLIEKLNTFQQKIIQLQLDNKKLKENGDTTRAKQEELSVKAGELHDLERRLDEHKKALEEKEQELNLQLLKLKEIEEENEQQRQKIDKLEELQDEGIIRYIIKYMCTGNSRFIKIRPQGSA